MSYAPVGGVGSVGRHTYQGETSHMPEGQLPKAEYRAMRRAARAEQTAKQRNVEHGCRGCGSPLPSDGVCSKCYRQGVR